MTVTKTQIDQSTSQLRMAGEVIGVLCKDSERDAVREFFELFKTAWSFYSEAESYDIVISSVGRVENVNAAVLIVYGSDMTDLEGWKHVAVRSRTQEGSITSNGVEIPIYGSVLTFETEKGPQITYCIQTENQILFRVGYDLFKEIKTLLTVGQPIQYAAVPTFDLHISLLRQLILDAGVPVVEIPPVPQGYSFIACLTHDVDFLRLTDHVFDRTMFGFLYRATLGSSVEFLRRRIGLSALLQNWKAALSVPAVFAGFCRDFWFEDINRFLELEKELGTTFYFIPFKNRPGERVHMPHSKGRGAKYDLNDAAQVIRSIEQKGGEVGLHGIDAWNSRDKALQELNRVMDVACNASRGIRMHWLCFSEDSWRILDDTGFTYDSTFGYNETIGFRAGTAQVFRPLSCHQLLELPLHIQDVALFGRGRQEGEAWKQCKQVINKACTTGGVITVLWHTRSLAPERLWGTFYIRLLNLLRHRRAWFGTASQAVAWFKARRALHISDVRFSKDKVRIRVEGEWQPNTVGPILRIHLPGGAYMDKSWNGEAEIEIGISSPRSN